MTTSIKMQAHLRRHICSDFRRSHIRSDFRRSTTVWMFGAHGFILFSSQQSPQHARLTLNISSAGRNIYWLIKALDRRSSCGTAVATGLGGEVGVANERKPRTAVSIK